MVWGLKRSGCDTMTYAWTFRRTNRRTKECRRVARALAASNRVSYEIRACHDPRDERAILSELAESMELGRFGTARNVRGRKTALFRVVDSDAFDPARSGLAIAACSVGYACCGGSRLTSLDAALCGR